MAKKVIIIDDSITQLNLLKTVFASSNWEVYGARNAQNAWEMIFDCAPDLIITDAIMPKIGGFQLLRAIRENSLISKIPVIIYSILSHNNAKFYIGKSDKDYFLKKTDNTDQLLKMAQEAIETHPISDEEKIEILKSNIDNNHSSILFPIKEIKEIKEDIFNPENKQSMEQDSLIKQTEIDVETLSAQLKNIYNFTYSDEKLLSDFFAIIYPYIEYDLCLVNLYSFDKKKDLIYFDIRNLILSPVFQKKMLDEYKAQDVVLFKNYAPNLKMIVSQEEFFSRIEFSFEYREKNIANIIFYSREKSKWSEIINPEELKTTIYNFFRARYINKNLSSNNDSKTKYSQKLDFPFLNKQENKQDKNNYIALIEISNYETLEEELTSEELDIINLKISEKIIKCLEINEQIYKKSKDEYVAMITAIDDKQAYHKLNYIVNSIESINEIDCTIAASNCTIEGVFNVVEAQKIAKDALDNMTKEEKVVIKHARKQEPDTVE